MANPKIHTIPKKKSLVFDFSKLKGENIVYIQNSALEKYAFKPYYIIKSKDNTQYDFSSFKNPATGAWVVIYGQDPTIFMRISARKKINITDIIRSKVILTSQKAQKVAFSFGISSILFYENLKYIPGPKVEFFKKILKNDKITNPFYSLAQFNEKYCVVATSNLKCVTEGVTVNNKHLAFKSDALTKLEVKLSKPTAKGIKGYIGSVYLCRLDKNTETHMQAIGCLNVFSTSSK